MKFYHIDFGYSPIGFIRVEADSPEKAVELAKKIVLDNGAILQEALSVYEVDKLQPDEIENTGTLQ